MNQKDRSIAFVAVYLLLFKENEVLLLLRQNTGWEDGKYSLIAGHVDQGESASEAMIREAKEEGGIKIEKNNLQLMHITHRKTPEREIVDFFFTASIWSGEIKNNEPHKCGELKFYNLDVLPDNIIPYIREAIFKAKDKIPFGEFGWSCK